MFGPAFSLSPPSKDIQGRATSLLLRPQAGHQDLHFTKAAGCSSPDHIALFVKMLSTTQSQYYLAALLTVATTAAADSGCYSRAIGIIQAGDWIKCSNTAVTLNGASACCLPGSLCGEDSLCHTPESLSTGGNNWYPAGCTDPTYTDPVCRTSCSKSAYVLQTA